MPVDVEKQIDVLLAEYVELRTEARLRISQRVSFLGLFGAMGGYLVFRSQEITEVPTWALVVATVALGALWLWLGQLLNNLSERVAEIEGRVNELAGTDLLAWETRVQETWVARLLSWRSPPRRARNKLPRVTPE